MPAAVMMPPAVPATATGHVSATTAAKMGAAAAATAANVTATAAAMATTAAAAVLKYCLREAWGRRGQWRCKSDNRRRNTGL